MNNLSLTVLSEGTHYQKLRGFALRLHAGQVDEAYARYEMRLVCKLEAAKAVARFGEPMATAAEIDEAAAEVLAYHKARLEEDPPDLPWVVERPDGRKVRFADEWEAPGWLHRAQPHSVHHAVTHEGWRWYREGKDV